MAQCGVVATVSKSNILCGDTVYLNAIPNGCKPLNNNFNGGTVGPWAATPGGIVVNNSDATYACMTASPDAPFYFFMGSAANTPRDVESNALDLKACPNTGGSACWLMKYSSQGESGTCEGPDATGEGVYLEYNVGGGWVQIAYYDPNGGNDAQLTRWTEFCVPLPNAAITTATKFRWIQKASSGAGFDTWAIDNVRIILNTIGYKFDWLHDSQAASASPATPFVTPFVNTTYTVTYSNKSSGGTDTCTSTVSVTVTKPPITVASSSAAICPGNSTPLAAISPYQYTPPTVCTLATPAKYCDPIGTKQGSHQITNGTYTYTSGNCNVNIFGASNCGGAVTSQMLFKATDLLAKGMVAGKITSMQIEVASGGGSYQNLSINMSCTGLAALGCSFSPISANVYTSKTASISSGWNTFDFDNYYDWDGTSNIIVQVCYYLTTAGSENICVTRNVATSYASLSTSGTNGSGSASSWNCSSSSSFYATYQYLPNTIFSTCEPRNVNLIYSWTPTTGLSNPASRTPVASPTVTTTYTVSAYPSPYTQCATSASATVLVDDISASVNPNAVTICPPGTPSTVLNASGSSSIPYTGPVTYNSTTNNVAFPDNTPAGINNSIQVAGINPTTLSTNPVVKVCLNVTSTNVSQVKATLTSPAGTNFILYNSTGTGANFTNTCFVTGSPAIASGSAPYTGSFAPSAPYPTTGNVNGYWILNVADIKNPTLGNASGGTLNSWNITFNTNQNNPINYQWINTVAGLSSTTIASPTAAPNTTTTYTIKVTDALGCTATSKAIVGYCMAVPVNLSKELTAVRAGAAVNLTWQTAQEINNAYFEVERSDDGINFTTLTRKDGQGNKSSVTNYTYTDEHPGTGINYYRLKQIDFNRDFSYTNIVGIFFSSNYQNLEMNGLSPIPVLDVLSYKLFVLYSGEVIVTITDVSGKTVYTEKQHATSGVNDFSINVSSLQQGSYILKSTQNGQTDVKRFVK